MSQQLPSQLQSAAMMQPDKRPFSYLPTGGLSELQQRQTENRAVLDRHAASSSGPAMRPTNVAAPMRPQPQYAAAAGGIGQQYGTPHAGAAAAFPPPPPPLIGAQGGSFGGSFSGSFRPVNEGAANYRNVQSYYPGDGGGTAPTGSSQPASGCQSPVSDYGAFYPAEYAASCRDSTRSLSPSVGVGGGGGSLRSKFGSPTFGWSPAPQQPLSPPPQSDVVAYVLQPDGTMAAIKCPTLEQAAALAAIQENPGVRRSAGPPRRQVSGGGGRGVGSRTQGLSYKMLQALTLNDVGDGGGGGGGGGSDSVDGSGRSSRASDAREEVPAASVPRGIKIITRQSSHDSCHSQKSHDSGTDF